MRYEWDDNKNRANLSKHGVSFEIASLVFDDPVHLSIQDRHEGDEERWKTLGLVNGVVVLIVAHTYREDNTGKRCFVLSLHVKQQHTRGNAMSKVSKQQTEDLRRLAELPDESIDTSDISDITDWSGAKRGQFYRPVKQQITLRIDADLVAWFKSEGGKYQTRINSALREYVEGHSKITG